MSVDGYNGNPNLKKPGVQFEWTPELLEEYVKCAKDPIYFAERYIQIVTEEGLVPIKLYDYQSEIIEAITKHRNVVVATGRQQGKTTTAAAVILHYIIFNEYKTVGLLANKGDSAREILDRIKIAYEALPHWLQQGVIVWNKGSIELENGCKILAAATSSSAIRGKTLQLLYIDESAFVMGWEDFFSSVYPTISAGKRTKILLTSTPKGLNHFWKICKEAQEDVDENGEGKNGYKYIEVPWWRVPGRDEAWKQKTLASMGFNYEQFEQEFAVGFIGSQSTLISGQTLKNMSDSKPIRSVDYMKQYELPQDGHIYALVADVSRGKGLDYSAFTVMDVTEMPYRQVCTFRDNLITPVDYAGVIYRIGTLYNKAHVLIETNDLGAQVADTLFLEYGYEEMLFTESAGRSGKRISGGFGKKVDRGISTSVSVKATGCAILKLLCEQEQLILRDYQTIEELKRFVRKGNSYEAESGAHDDTVMPLVLFAWLSDQNFFQDITDINTLSKLRDKTEEELDDQLLPFGFSDVGDYEALSMFR